MQATVWVWPGRQVVHAAQVAALPVVLYVDPATQAAAQLLQDAALVVVLKVDPATQEVHTVFAVTVQEALLRLPAGHVLQGVHALFDVAVQAPV